MEAVIISGGKQYRVREGEVVRLERLPAEQGATVEFREVAYLKASAMKAGAAGVGALFLVILALFALNSGTSRPGGTVEPAQGIAVALGQ